MSTLPHSQIPRWAPIGDNENAVAEHSSALPGKLATALYRYTAESGFALPAVLLAVHVKVLAAVTADRSVLTGYVPANGPTTLVHHTVTDTTWRRLIADLSTVEQVDAGDGCEAVLDLSESGDTELPDSTAVSVAYRHTGGELTLSVRFRTSVMNEEHAARLAGYHRAVLLQLLACPDGRHLGAALLSDQELRTQLHDLAGPIVPLPEALFVELFEEQVRAHPDDLAVSHRDRAWTYGDLNARANGIAHALLREGLTAEDPVAVVMDRDLDWVAALLGVFKAGGVYLPIRPDFPVDRVATQLRAAACRYGVTEADSARTLRGAIEVLGADGFTVVSVEAEADSAHITDPGVPITPGQLAYIYFTSGSTGEPKGAMCEHEGMLNHFLFKIADTGLRSGDVLTQTASQCFDISLWQVVTPLLVGASTLIVDTDAQLDVAGFVGMLADGGVDVIQVVPSFLDVMVSHLARNPSSLGDVRVVSVTGEALKLDLVRRWFAVEPDIGLINGYGATEVHDVATQEALDGVPRTDFVSIGRPRHNVRVYVLDEESRLAPLGTPGEIAFAGVCVGRGYINDEERTALAFARDPHRPSDRMYRTGDFGRWLPDGSIEFLGRRDQQVKVRGYRVEIGEIEKKLLSMPEVDECAVIVQGAADDTKRLVAWYTTSTTVRAGQLRDFLATLLPEYMVPAAFHRLPSLPLTENGKVDKKTLARMAAATGQGGTSHATPETDVERRLAAAWSDVLNVPVEHIGRDDEFFDLGGTSLAAVRLIVQLDRAISLTQLMARPALAELARSISGTGAGQPAPRG